ncbi:hypothetical protein [Thaumasiovibrio subtropicus]|uniref:hypothetical protein n=1 Tax=Thaumasiovibrio subtropicus TaxID=1891207 RepID=UPI00131D9B44|nr:hypothetical protein [Thaumasiovibrio subtropicus]
MIFFGTRGKVINGPVLEGVKCPHCDHDQFATFGVARYFHLYWIPTFPTSTVTDMECLHCKKSVMDKEMPTELRKEVKAQVCAGKKLWWRYAGVMLIATAIGVGTINAKVEDSNTIDYLKQPVANDVYLSDFTLLLDNIEPGYNYGAMRVKHVTANEVELELSKFVYNKRSGVREDIRNGEAYDDAYYSEDMIYLDIPELQQLKSDGIVLSVTRQ